MEKQNKEAEKLYEQLGKNIKKMRLDREWSQTDLAFHAGIDKSHVQSLERGNSNSTIKTLLKISKAFKIKFYELFLF